MDKRIDGVQVVSHRGSDLFCIELFNNMILRTLVAEAWRFVCEVVYWDEEPFYFISDEGSLD